MHLEVCLVKKNDISLNLNVKDDRIGKTETACQQVTVNCQIVSEQWEQMETYDTKSVLRLRKDSVWQYYTFSLEIKN